MHKKLEATAYHEAGHVVVAALLNKRFATVTIIPKEDSFGHVLYLETNERIINLIQGCGEELLEEYEIDKLVRDHLTISLSGYTSELKFGIDNTEGASSDFETVVDLALSHAGNTATDLVDECMNLSTELIAANWDKVELVANLLLTNRQISEKEVLEIMVS